VLRSLLQGSPREIDVALLVLPDGLLPGEFGDAGAVSSQISNCRLTAANV
jgi:hypothetical protein